MFDFMKTINNMNNVNSKREFDFFMQNKERVEDLISRYNTFREGIRSQQIQRIASLEEQVEERTKADWKKWEDWRLYISFNDDTNRIGIDSYYEATEKGYCGEFHIYITTWRKEHWPPYKEAVLKAFPDKIRLDDNSGNRVDLHLPIIDGKNEEEIVSALVDAYNKLKKITDEIH